MKDTTSADHKGYIWKFYGFTKLHLWGCHITGGTLVAIGTGLLTVAAMLWKELPDRVFHRLVLMSIACFAGATSVAAGSIFSLVYFLGRRLLREVHRPACVPESALRNDVTLETK